MADVSLHYSSKAPLAGTFTAFSQLVATWRRRARERRELANLDHRTLRDLGLSPATSSSRPTSPSGAASSRIPEPSPFLPCRAHPSPDPGRRSTLSLPVDRRLFLCPRAAPLARGRGCPFRPPDPDAGPRRRAARGRRRFCRRRAPAGASRRSSAQFGAGAASPGPGAAEARPFRRGARAPGARRQVPAQGCRRPGQSRRLPHRCWASTSRRWPRSTAPRC